MEANTTSCQHPFYKWRTPQTNYVTRTLSTKSRWERERSLQRGTTLGKVSQQRACWCGRWMSFREVKTSRSHRTQMRVMDVCKLASAEPRVASSHAIGCLVIIRLSTAQVCWGAQLVWPGVSRSWFHEEKTFKGQYWIRLVKKF